ncbi:acyltransferase family protein [Comamonas koreensis]|uniref:Acyltransferase n=1 Tax=Comamonas koreensis TaxID=160825 RepID=A0AAW4XZY9_9BURK|nr:acyltransferase [Comamonas koreensis]MCD2166937.1 acyltransferase [Comamonas koreensis]
MIQSIQILRFAAALWVALYHAQSFSFFPHLPKWLRAIAEGGFVGVDIFFVISGVIMALATTNTPSGPRPAAQFVATRFSRIYTGWWPAMLLYVLGLQALGAMPPDVNLLSSALLYPANFSLHINAVIWTLVYELYFYLLIGASLLLPKPWRDRTLAAWGLVIVALVLYYAASGRYRPDMFSQATQLVWFYAAPLVLEFFAGYFVYRWLQRHPQQRWWAWLLTSALLCAAAVYYSVTATLYAPGIVGFFHWPERALLVGAAATALVGAALLLPAPRHAAWRLVAKLGDYAFAIYLLHLLVFQLAQRFTTSMALEIPHRSLSLLLVLAALVALSALYYHAIEHPIYQACRRAIARWGAPKP